MKIINFVDMKSAIGKFIVMLALACTSLQAGAQMKLYTRTFRIQDFKSRTTKVVLDGPAELRSALREEVTALWTASPYEFCTLPQYEKSKADPDYYFVRPVVSKGLICLVLSKGGREGDPNTLKTPLTLISVPVAGENYLEPVKYMAAYISFIQDYMDKAMESDAKALLGLGAIRTSRPGKLKVIKDPAEAQEAFLNREPLSAVQVFISPDGSAKSKPHAKYLIGTEAYELYSFSR